MKIIICGAGQVGYNIAQFLSEEGNNVTVIDHDVALISNINEDLDVNGMVGQASNPDMLNEAGAGECDILIAVTKSDETNMVACQIAHSLFGVPKKIARIRNQAYLQPAWSNLFSRTHLPIDIIISPEVVMAEEIYKRLSVPNTTYVTAIADGTAHVIGLRCKENCPLLATPLNQFSALFPDLEFKIIAILRDGEPLFPDDSEQLQSDDEVFLITKTDNMPRVMSAFGFDQKKGGRIVIFGGGNIGYGLAKLVAGKGRNQHTRIIEHNEERALYLSEKLEKNIVINGSSIDKDILKEVGIEKTETAIAVTNDDETNILSSLLAKQQGCKRVITLVNNDAYSTLIGPLGLDTIVNPRSSIVAKIMQHIRRGRIKGLHSLRDGFAEVIEAEISDVSKIANTSIAELEFPEGIFIAAVIRGKEFILPKPDFIIREDDLVVVLAADEASHEIDNLFSVKVDLF